MMVLLGVACAGSAAASAFPDVPKGVPYAEAIEALKTKGIVGGYGDGSFRPNRTLNRAEFLKLLTTLQVDAKNAGCRPKERSFGDVPIRAWYAPSVCVAKKKGIVEGYRGGSFKPSEKITFGEAAKMIAIAFGQNPETATPWQKPYIEYLANQHAIPVALGSVDQNLTRGQAAEILWRLKEAKKELPSPSADKILAAKCDWIRDGDAKGMDMEEVRRTWLQWLNDARAQEDLPAYYEDRELDRTAFLWSSQAAAKGAISHKRPGQTAYYDYARITDWFHALGLDFQNDHRITFTENIGWGYYACAVKDCTADLMRAVRSTFDIYMAEKEKKDRPHYNSVMNAYFREVGVGIALDPAAKQYYITTHYGTSITSDPAPVCP